MLGVSHHLVNLVASVAGMFDQDDGLLGEPHPAQPSQQLSSLPSKHGSSNYLDPSSGLDRCYRGLLVSQVILRLPLAGLGWLSREIDGFGSCHHSEMGGLSVLNQKCRF